LHDEKNYVKNIIIFMTNASPRKEFVLFKI